MPIVEKVNHPKKTSWGKELQSFELSPLIREVHSVGKQRKCYQTVIMQMLLCIKCITLIFHMELILLTFNQF